MLSPQCTDSEVNTDSWPWWTGQVRSVHTSAPCFGLPITMGRVIGRPLWEPATLNPRSAPGLLLAPSSSMVNLQSPETVDLGVAGNRVAGNVLSLSVAVTAAGFLGTGLGTLETLCQEQLVTDQAKKGPLSSILPTEFAPLSLPPIPSSPHHCHSWIL